MGLDLRLSGLASGFDWKPVVEQLIELERIPQARLEQEKEENETKISELGILKSQLEALESASKTLQSNDIYDARKVVLGENTEDYFTATAAVGTLTGEYKVSVYSLGTSSFMTSDSLKPDGVGKALDTATLLRNLPMQTAITAGTFTVESQTYEITQSDLDPSTGKSLQALLDEISADPEGNGYPVTFEYDAAEDRVIVDGGELDAVSPSALPILGHPNDSSNFLKVTRLLDGEVVTRFSDQDQFRTFDSTQAWLRKGDSNLNTSNPADPHGLPDQRNFTYSATSGKAYQRLTDTTPDFFDSNKLDYVIGDEVYMDGFLYRCKKALPTELYFTEVGSPGDTDYYAARIDGGETIRIAYDSGTPAGFVDSIWELKNDPRGHANSGISSPVHAWNALGDRQFRSGDVVAVTDSGVQYYAEAQQDSPFHQGAVDLITTGHQYAANDKVEDPSGSGMFYKASAKWGTDITVGSADEDSGARYAADALRFDASDVVHKATTNWVGVLDHDPATTVYDSGDFVWDGVSDSGAYTPNFTMYTLPIDHAIQADHLVDPSGIGTTYYKPVQEILDWGGGPYNLDDLVHDSNKFWKSDINGNTDTPGVANWTEVTADVTNVSDTTYWTDVTTAVEDTDLASNAYWRAAEFSDTHLWTNFNTEVTTVTDTDYWTPEAYINDTTDFDANYWTLITPGSGGGFWEEIATVGPDLGADADIGTGDEDQLGNTDTEFWETVATPDPTDAVLGTQYWAEVTESYIRSSQALGAIDVSSSLGGVSANWDGTLATGTGSFFIGEGPGAVEIAYDTAVDTITDLIERVNTSDAKVTMSYDSVGDQFIVQSDVTGTLGITLNESATWDSINVGSGNLLEMMGLAAPTSSAAYPTYDDATAYLKGDYVKHTDGTTNYWQATEDIAAGSGTTPGGTDQKWEQVTLGTGRAMSDNLGENAIITINGGDRIFSQSNVFNEDAHGVSGLTINLSDVTTEGASFFVERDLAPATSAIDKFLEEFNDAQQYINSLVEVTRDGDEVTTGRFSGNLEISRLGSRLRKLVFGTSHPHSASETTSDGTNKTVADYTARDALSTNFDVDNDGYRVYVTDIAPDTDLKYHYQEWTNAGGWADFEPTFSSFRVNDIGLDFQSGSDEIFVENSALLTQELTDNPNKVKALFSEEKPSAPVFDHNEDALRDYGGLTYFLTEFIDNFIESDSGTYKTHVGSLQSQNDRLDISIEDLERYLIQREKTLSQSFIRMEEMQSRMNSQMQTLQSSFPNN